ncbi:MAG: hypothetical protein QOH54_3659 [Mycobacterium sp.]|nr:hypothetical protein [Mycobacterium sp.]
MNVEGLMPSANKRVTTRQPEHKSQSQHWSPTYADLDRISAISDERLGNRFTNLEEDVDRVMNSHPKPNFRRSRWRPAHHPREHPRLPRGKCDHVRPLLWSALPSD